MSEHEGEAIVLEGHLSIEAALAGEVRPVHEILAVRPGDRRLGRLRALARERGVTIRGVGAAEIASLSSGRSHGDVLALVGPRRYLSVAELARNGADAPLIMMLDGVEDPFNLGSAIRSLYAAGVDGLVIRQRDWESAASIVTRSSAGASELLPTAMAASAEEAAELFRGAGFRIACAVRAADALLLNEAPLAGPIFILVGGERRGITRSFVERADMLLQVPYGRPDAPALTAATAAAVIAFEALRQRLPDEGAG